jgi:hypothetical protein
MRSPDIPFGMRLLAMSTPTGSLESSTLLLYWFMKSRNTMNASRAAAPATAAVPPLVASSFCMTSLLSE